MLLNIVSFKCFYSYKILYYKHKLQIQSTKKATYYVT